MSFCFAAEQAAPTEGRAPVLLLLLSLQGLAGSLHSPAPSPDADSDTKPPAKPSIPAGLQRRLPTLPWAAQRCWFGEVWCRWFAPRMLHTAGSAHREKLLWSLRSCPKRVGNSLKPMLAVGEHSVFCALVLFSLNKSLLSSRGAQAPPCTSLPCVWQEQRAFSKPRFPTAAAASMPGQEMSRVTKPHF